MALTDDPTSKGDFEIKARGASALMAREVRSNFWHSAPTCHPSRAAGAVGRVRPRPPTMETSGLVKTIQEIQAETEKRHRQAGRAVPAADGDGSS